MNDAAAGSFRAPPLAALPRDDDGLRNYTIFIRDERYSVPTVRFVTVATETRAAELAAALLLESHHHLAVELCEDDKLLACFDRDGVTWLNDQA